jgi:PAS domain-containing protein
MLARRLPGILPPMSREESLEVTRVLSVAGRLVDGNGLVRRRPFRSPHHHISLAGLVGGGSGLARPGEVSLAQATLGSRAGVLCRHTGVVQNRKMAVIRRLAFIAAIAGLVASCSASGDAECQPASSAYRELFRNESITRAPVESDILVMDSAVRDAWYIVAKVGGSIPVWVTDRDPQGEEVGRIITANRAAQRLSSADFVDMPLSRSESAQAAGDPDRIAVVESCVSG